MSKKLQKISGNVKANKSQMIMMGVMFIVIIGFISYLLFGGKEETNLRSSERSNVGGIGANRVTNNVTPDTESIVDPSSPIAKNARATEEKEASEARESGQTYIGDVFNDGQSEGMGAIKLPEYVPEPEPEPEPKPEPVEEVVKVVDRKEEKDVNKNTSAKKPIPFTFNGGSGPRANTDFSNYIEDKDLPSAGSTQVFVKYNDRGSSAGATSKSGMSGNSGVPEVRDNKLEMAEVLDRNRNSAAQSNEYKITLGSKFYATTAFAVNSDDGGPALAIIREGPLKNAKLQGSYQVNELAKAINVTYDKMSHKGKTYDINAISYNLDNDRTVLADSVDNHYMQRYGGLFLSAFIAEYADSLDSSTSVVSDSGSVTTIDDGIESESDRVKSALGGPAELLVDELSENVDRPITVHVSNDKGVGVYFMEDIIIQE